MTAFKGDVDWMCDKIKMEYDGRKLFLSTRHDLEVLLDGVEDESVEEVKEDMRRA